MDARGVCVWLNCAGPAADKEASISDPGKASPVPILGAFRPRASLADEVAERIRQLVLAGGLPAGTKLSDSRLAEELGLGRGSVREAFRLLLAEGFLERTSKGVRIARLTEEDVNDIFELRLAIECYATRMLAARHDETELRVLRRLVSELQKANEADDAGAAVMLDLEFHDSVCRLSGSRRLHDVFTREVEKMLALVRVDVDFYLPLSDWVGELPEIMDAIERGDGDEASAAMEHHILRSRDIVMAFVRHTTQ